MNGNFVFQRDDSQNSSLKFLNFAPKPMPISFLRFAFQRLFQDSNAPFFLQIRTLAQDFVLKIFGEPVLRHVYKIPRLASDNQSNAKAEKRRSASFASGAVRLSQAVG